MEMSPGGHALLVGAGAGGLHVAFSRYALSGRRLTADFSLLRARTSRTRNGRQTHAVIPAGPPPSLRLAGPLKAKFRPPAPAPASSPLTNRVRSGEMMGESMDDPECFSENMINFAYSGGL